MPTHQKVRIVCISDTHNHAPGEGYTLPKGDILIHAGDLTNQGSLAEIKKVVEWIEKTEFAVKVVVAGNHDISLDANYALENSAGWHVQPDEPEVCRDLLTHNTNFTYLHHSSAVVDVPDKHVSLRMFGSPYSPDRGRQNWAFQYNDEQAQGLWDAIPAETDIIVTHTPPAEYCDASTHWQEGGCPALLKALGRVRPLLHVCGHCHEGRGAKMVHWDDSEDSVASSDGWQDPGAGNKKQSLFDLTSSRDRRFEAGQATAVVNASIMAKSFGRGTKSFNKPIIVDIDVSALSVKDR
ncbi:hypothetical protein LTR17_022703 [Elasticomyces elasticus]|nr:hypothetical protein LTR17_022703 [Elasticomyces elasticus]